MIDLVAIRGGKRTAFEIETGKSNATANARKCLEAGMDRVTLVATTGSVRDSLVQIIPDDPRVACVTPDEAMAFVRVVEGGDSG